MLCCVVLCSGLDWSRLCVAELSLGAVAFEIVLF